MIILLAFARQVKKSPFNKKNTGWLQACMVSQIMEHEKRTIKKQIIRINQFLFFVQNF